MQSTVLSKTIFTVLYGNTHTPQWIWMCITVLTLISIIHHTCAHTHTHTQTRTHTHTHSSISFYLLHITLFKKALYSTPLLSFSTATTSTVNIMSSSAITQNIFQRLAVIVVLHDADTGQHRVTQNGDVTHSARHQHQSRRHALWPLPSSSKHFFHWDGFIADH